MTVQWALGKHGPPSEVMEGFTKVVSKKVYDDRGKDISLANKDQIEKKRKADEKARKVAKLKEKATKYVIVETMDANKTKFKVFWS